MGQPAFLYPAYAASSVSVTASGSAAGTAPANVLEAVEDTCWQPASPSGTQTLTFDFATPQAFDSCVIIGESLAGVIATVEASANASDWVSLASDYAALVADTARNLHTDPTPYLNISTHWAISSLVEPTPNAFFPWLNLEMTQPPPAEGPTTATWPKTAPFVPCIPGDTFVAFCRIFIPTAFYSDGGTPAQLGIKFYDSGGNYFSVAVAGSAVLASRDVWQYIGGPVTVPAAAASYRVMAFLSHATDAEGFVYFDDFFLGRPGDLLSVSSGGAVSPSLVDANVNRLVAPSNPYRYRRLNFTGLGASSKITHVIFAALAAGTLPYFPVDFDVDALDVTAQALISAEGYFLGSTHSRSMRAFACDFGLLSAPDAAVLRAWAHACVKTPRAFAFVPDVDLSTTYFVWQEKPEFRLPQTSNGLYRPNVIELSSRINHAD